MTTLTIIWNLEHTTTLNLPTKSSAEEEQDLKILMVGKASHPIFYLPDSNRIGRRIELVMPEGGFCAQLHIGGKGQASATLGFHKGSKTYEWRGPCPNCSGCRVHGGWETNDY